MWISTKGRSWAREYQWCVVHNYVPIKSVKLHLECARAGSVIEMLRCPKGSLVQPAVDINRGRRTWLWDITDHPPLFWGKKYFSSSSKKTEKWFFFLNWWRGSIEGGQTFFNWTTPLAYIHRKSRVIFPKRKENSSSSTDEEAHVWVGRGFLVEHYTVLEP